jgi:hypothetical protein
MHEIKISRRQVNDNESYNILIHLTYMYLLQCVQVHKFVFFHGNSQTCYTRSSVETRSFTDITLCLFSRRSLHFRSTTQVYRINSFDTKTKHQVNIHCTVSATSANSYLKLTESKLNISHCLQLFITNNDVYQRLLAPNSSLCYTQIKSFFSRFFK